MEVSTGKSYSKPMTLAEFEEINAELDKIHGNN
jgi:hypothetical protein